MSLNEEPREQGSKATNLLKLKMLVQQLKTDNGIQVSVPNFITLKSIIIKNLLKHANLDIEQEWQKAIKHIQSPLQFNMDLPEEFLKAVQQLPDKISVAINNLILRQVTIPNLPILNNSDHLIVRSNGAEDTITNLNAGGNVSVPFVLNKEDAIWTAISQVLQSYFSEQSLRQRWTALKTEEQFKNEFASPPCMAVLLQQMVGETPTRGINIGINIPITGNLLTTEPDGNTTGVTLITAGYGAEAGTQPDLTVDKYYIDNNDWIIPILAVKRNRLAPVNNNNEIQLKDKSNTITNSNSSCLTREWIVELKKIAEHIKKQYKEELEIEFVIQPSQNHIFLVQARPFRKQVSQQANYLAEECIQNTEIFPCRVLACNQPQVIILEQASQYIIAETVDQALKRFLSASDKTAIKCIVVHHDAAPLSHPVVTLRANALPIVVFDDIPLLADSANFVIDSQRQILIVAKEKLALKEGWINHPLPAQISLKLTEFNQISLDKIELSSNSTNNFFKDIELLSQLKQQEFKAKLQQLLYSLVKTYQHYAQAVDEKTKLLYREIIGYFNILFQIAKWDELLPINKLYYLNWLKALLLQEQNSNLINNYSLKQFLSIAKLENSTQQITLTRYTIKPLSEYKLQLTKLVNLAVNTKIKGNILRFIRQADSETEKLLGQITYFYAEQDLLFWLVNRLFNIEYDYTLLVEKISQLPNQISENENSIKQLLTLKSQVQFSISTSNQKLNNLIEACTTTEMLELAKSDNDIVRPLFINILFELIETIDQTIKYLKIDIDKSFDKKVAMREILKIYLKLAIKLENIKTEGANLSTVLDNDKIDKLDSLEPSEFFNVNWMLAELSGKIRRDKVIRPCTLEDAFTLIHQYLLYIIAQKQTHNFPLSEILASFQGKLLNIGSSLQEIYKSCGAAPIMLVQQRYHFPYIECLYNFPLRFHAIGIILNYNLKQDCLRIQIALNGNSEHGRNERLQLMLDAFLVSLSGFNMISISCEDYSCSLEGIVTPEFNIDNLEILLRIVIDTSIAVDFNINLAATKIFDLEETFFQTYKLTEQQRKQIADYVIQYTIKNNYFHPLLAQAIVYCSTDRHSFNLYEIQHRLACFTYQCIEQQYEINLNPFYKANLKFIYPKIFAVTNSLLIHNFGIELAEICLLKLPDELKEKFSIDENLYNSILCAYLNHTKYPNEKLVFDAQTRFFDKKEKISRSYNLNLKDDKLLLSFYSLIYNYALLRNALFNYRKQEMLSHLEEILILNESCNILLKSFIAEKDPSLERISKIIFIVKDIYQFLLSYSLVNPTIIQLGKVIDILKVYDELSYRGNDNEIIEFASHHDIMQNRTMEVILNLLIINISPYRLQKINNNQQTLSSIPTIERLQMIIAMIQNLFECKGWRHNIQNLKLTEDLLDKLMTQILNKETFEIGCLDNKYKINFIKLLINQCGRCDKLEHDKKIGKIFNIYEANRVELITHGFYKDIDLPAQSYLLNLYYLSALYDFSRNEKAMLLMAKLNNLQLNNVAKTMPDLIAKLESKDELKIIVKMISAMDKTIKYDHFVSDDNIDVNARWLTLQLFDLIKQLLNHDELTDNDFSILRNCIKKYADFNPLRHKWADDFSKLREQSNNYNEIKLVAEKLLQSIEESQSNKRKIQEVDEPAEEPSNKKVKSNSNQPIPSGTSHLLNTPGIGAFVPKSQKVDNTIPNTSKSHNEGNFDFVQKK